MSAVAATAIRLADIPGVWRGTRARPAAPVEPTGSASLDDALLGGWPLGALTQLVSSHAGLGFSLLLPVLARLTAAGKTIALIQTPFIPYAPALASRGVALSRLIWVQPRHDTDALWALEQMLRSGLIAAAVYWGSSASLAGNTERRLQLAAETHRCLAFCLHTGRAEAHSYAAARIAVRPAENGRLAIEVLKCRGGTFPLPLRERVGLLAPLRTGPSLFEVSQQRVASVASVTPFLREQKLAALAPLSRRCAPTSPARGEVNNRAAQPELHD